MSLLKKERQTCGRRMFDLGPWEREEGLDDWKGKGGIIGQHAVGRCCSFCGSLHPEDFMEKVREGWIVGGTDKNYKWYLDKPRTPEQIAKIKADNPNLPEVLVSAGDTVAKFYTVHLTRPLAEEFLQLWRDGKLNHSMYRRPWLPSLADGAPEWLTGMSS